MSTIPGFSAAATSGYGVRGQVLAGAAQARERLDALTRQAANGRVADTFGGLGAGAATSLALRPELTRLQGWQANIAAAQGRMDVAAGALDQQQRGDLADAVLDRAEPDEVAVEFGEHLEHAGLGKVAPEVDRLRRLVSIPHHSHAPRARPIRQP